MGMSTLELIGVSALFVMLFIFALCVIHGVVALFVCAFKKMYYCSVMTLAYILVLCATTFYAAVPFVKMSGSYSDVDKIFMAFFCLANSALIIYVITRIKVMKGGLSHASHGGA
jgi:hypothetical protein